MLNNMRSTGNISSSRSQNIQYTPDFIPNLFRGAMRQQLLFINTAPVA